MSHYSSRVQLIAETERNLHQEAEKIIDDIERGNVTSVTALPLFADILGQYAKLWHIARLHMEYVEQELKELRALTAK